MDTMLTLIPMEKLEKITNFRSDISSLLKETTNAFII